MINPYEIIAKFIISKKYMKNDHVLGVFFYGSYLTGYNDDYSDINLFIVFDNNDPKHLIKGNSEIDGIKVEYFEKPIDDIYLSIENDYNNQNNCLLSAIGTSDIIFDNTGQLQKLQKYTKKKFTGKLPELEINDAREYVSILNNKMKDLQRALEENSPFFDHLYHIITEKIRKFYHRSNGLPEVETSKVYRLYLNKEYRQSFYKNDIPGEEFIKLYLTAILINTNNKEEKYNVIKQLYDYAKKDIFLKTNDYRILIKSPNKQKTRQ